MAITFESFVSKSKPVGVLYHLLTEDKLRFVLDTNKLEARNFVGISMTRSKQLNSYLGSNGQVIAKLKIDGNMLSNDYQIEPYQYISDTGIRLENEEESLVKTNVIKNIKKYIIAVILLENSIVQYRTYFGKSKEDQNELKEFELLLSRASELGTVIYE